MSNISWNDAVAANQEIPSSSRNYKSNNSSTQPQVGFFSLKSDGDFAYVRFLCDSTDDFEILNTHEITVGGKSRKVNCLRKANEPLDACPFCSKFNDGKAAYPIKQKFYFKLIQYTVDETGKVTPSAKIWERSYKFALRVATAINDYGKLSEYVCKITRTGAAGSTDTDYTISVMPQNAIYSEAKYPKSAQLFEGYTALGRIVMNKSAEDINTFLSTGEFPAKVYNNNNAAETTAPAKTYSEAPTPVAKPATTSYNTASTIDDSMPF